MNSDLKWFAKHKGKGAEVKQEGAVEKIAQLQTREEPRAEEEGHLVKADVLKAVEERGTDSGEKSVEGEVETVPISDKARHRVTTSRSYGCPLLLFLARHHYDSQLLVVICSNPGRVSHSAIQEPAHSSYTRTYIPSKLSWINNDKLHSAIPSSRREYGHTRGFLDYSQEEEFGLRESSPICGCRSA
ncbi:hypothetical protein BDY19DRAFT_685642 [Irpex rosettiformis]|uniref:Uncharacterized protein n=1 Tax=Irpex rosettiformis TaxID=378272 RepID=A0ACB8UA70_9APHY|nr:hypothetical protein BDY19DRAFT_685642 [Irpex rosettiformis]